MYIMLYGLLFNCIYILETTKENKTKQSCIVSYLANNIVMLNFSN